MTLRPVASTARARAATSNALSVPIVLIRDARRTAFLLPPAAAGRTTRALAYRDGNRRRSVSRPARRRGGVAPRRRGSVVVSVHGRIRSSEIARLGKSLLIHATVR